MGGMRLIAEPQNVVVDRTPLLNPEFLRALSNRALFCITWFGALSMILIRHFCPRRCVELEMRDPVSHVTHTVQKYVPSHAEDLGASIFITFCFVAVCRWVPRGLFWRTLFRFD